MSFLETRATEGQGEIYRQSTSFSWQGWSVIELRARTKERTGHGVDSWDPQEMGQFA